MIQLNIYNKEDRQIFDQEGFVTLHTPVQQTTIKENKTKNLNIWLEGNSPKMYIPVTTYVDKIIFRTSDVSDEVLFWIHYNFCIQPFNEFLKRFENKNLTYLANCVEVEFI